MTLRSATKAEYDAMVARLADELDAAEAAQVAANNERTDAGIAAALPRE